MAAYGTSAGERRNSKATGPIGIDNVQLLQGFDVLACEGHGHHHDGTMAFGRQYLQRLLRAWTEPALTAHATLEGEPRPRSQGENSADRSHRGADVVQIEVAVSQIGFG